MTMPTNIPSEMSNEELVDRLVFVTEEIDEFAPDTKAYYAERDAIKAKLMIRLNRAEGLEARIQRDVMDMMIRVHAHIQDEEYRVLLDAMYENVPKAITATFAAVRDDAASGDGGGGQG